MDIYTFLDSSDSDNEVEEKLIDNNNNKLIN
jgi:hypothetical protein